MNSARVVEARMEPRGRERHRWANQKVERVGAHESTLSVLGV